MYFVVKILKWLVDYIGKSSILNFFFFDGHPLRPNLSSIQDIFLTSWHRMGTKPTSTKAKERGLL